MTTKHPLSLKDIQQRLDHYPIPKADLVIGIGRGGAIPAQMVAQKMGAKLLVIQVNYRDDENTPQREIPVFLEDLEVPIEKGSKILLVDDVSVTGKTLQTVKEKLKGYVVTTLVFKGKADHVLFPEINTCVDWPWKSQEISSAEEPKDRRSFLKSLAGLTAGMMLPLSGKPLTDAFGNILTTKSTPENDRLGELLPRRKFGKTGTSVTMLGLGGAHIAQMSEKEAQKTIETALAGGLRFFDNAESYGNGLSEKRYGMFLTPKYRDVAFIQSKSTARDAKTMREHLEGSLKRMNTDYLDLWFIHAVGSPSDVDSRIKNGVLDVVLEAQKSGKVKYVGFSGHADYKAHLRMLERTDALQVCQMPINAFDPNYKSFINNVLPQLIKKEMAPIAMKTLANGGFFGGTSHFNHGDKPRIVPNALSVEEALYFSWSLPISVLVTGADHAEMLQEKIELAKKFKVLDEKKRMALVEKVAGFDGRLVEYYKV
ncbi:Predicted oxidoreductase [Aquiflexum balticum DSM 16537]|uniref:Predicted oxidoreductase n=1 Tax=Aquiflexum balticum DSM 16537 TaxID=758820 RepID=A0A1W2HAA5_9BACT|nr:aldo/keto reductase [Aquiflexum balticum]SMD45721.1 Predicted oxidoreductase [Aquiflexum balticum DSM 16537]